MWMLLWGALAFGQDVPAAGEARWVVADVEATRFYGLDAHKVPLSANDEVEVITTEGDRVRVMADGRYGWVAASALTDVEPEVAVEDSPLLDNPALTTPITIPGLDLDLGGK